MITTNAMDYKTYEEKVRDATNHAKKHVPGANEKGMVVDHIVPILFGWEYNIPIELMSNLKNLQCISVEKNLKKGSSITEESVELLQYWRQNGLVSDKVSYFIEKKSKATQLNYDWSKVYEELHIPENMKMYTMVIPTVVAFSIDPVFCQRSHEDRWQKTKKALGRVALPTHRKMSFCVYPDGRIRRLDGNTRTYVWENNLQFDEYIVPESISADFYAVENDEEAEILYHSIDSIDTAETFSEKISGYLRFKNYRDNLPTQFRKGEKVYDIMIVAIDNFIPKNEKEPLSFTHNKNIGYGDKAKKTVELLDYFIPELVSLGSVINQDTLPRSLTAPLCASLVRHMMRDGHGQVNLELQKIVEMTVDACKYGRNVFERRKGLFADSVDSVILKNIEIMLDELLTPESTNAALNPRIDYRETTTRQVLPYNATKTTVNTTDRRIYCGFVHYVIDKCLNGEEMSEDLLLELTGKKVTDETPRSDSNQVEIEAISIVQNVYDNFWKQ